MIGGAGHDRIPHLRGSAPMYWRGYARDSPVERRRKKIAFELDRREIQRAFGQMSNAPIPACRIRQRDNGRCMQITIRREKVGTDDDLRGQLTILDCSDAKTDEAGQITGAARVEGVECDAFAHSASLRDPG